MKINHFLDTDDSQTAINAVFVDQVYNPPWFFSNTANIKSIIDIGASMGSFSIWASKKWPNATIYSYEPDPDNFKLLEQNIHDCDTEKIKVINKGIWKKTQKIDLNRFSKTPLSNSIVFKNQGHQSTFSESISISVKSINELLDEFDYDIDLMKIDCEGSEYEILYSLDESKLKKIQRLVIEYHDFIDDEKNNSFSLNTFLQKSGFKTHIIPTDIRKNLSLGYIYAIQNIDNTAQTLELIFKFHTKYILKQLEIIELQKIQLEHFILEYPLDKKRNELQKSLMDLEKQHNDLEKQHNDLEKQHNEVKNENLAQNLEKQHNDLEKQRLQSSLRSLDKELNDLQKQHDDLEKQHDDLEKQHNDLEKQHNEVKNENLAQNLEKQHNDLEKQRLQSSLRSLDKELNDLKNSILFGPLFKFVRCMDNIFPPHTKRGEFIRLIRISSLIIRNEGFSSFLIVFNEKLHHSRLGKHKKDKYLKSNSVLSSTIKKLPDQKIIYSDGDFEPNIEFQNAISTTSSTLPHFPKVSIIIATYNQLEFLRKNIQSIEKNTIYPNFEIIIITNNNDKTSPIRKFLKTIEYQVIYYDDEYSFSNVNNFAAKEATGDFLLFLNDDVEIITPNWLDDMLKLCIQKNTGAVGSKLLFPDGTLQEAGGIIWKDGSIWNYGRNKNSDDFNYNFVRKVDYCSGSCLMIKKELFEKINGFDPIYHPAYCEDADLCLTLQQMGFDILYQPKSVLIHHEGSTSSNSTTSAIKLFQITNQQKLRKKWNNYLQNSHSIDSLNDEFISRNRKSGLNILYVDHYLPEYDKDAGSLTAFYMISTLNFLNHAVTFWPDNLNKTEPYSTQLQQKGVEVIYGRNNFEDFFKERGNSFDICFLSRPHISPKYLKIIKKYHPDCKIVYDTVDLGYIREFRESKIKNDSSLLKKSEQTKQYEFDIISNSDITIVRTKIEADILKKELPSSIVAVIPPLQLIQKTTSHFDDTKDLLFVGSFNHPPNVDAVTYLIKDIFPVIHKKMDNVILNIVGSNPPQNLIELCSKIPGINFLGYVPDLEPLLKNSRLMLAPMQYGSGMKGKITQSMSYGLPVITTSIGAEGIVKKDGNILRIADTIDDFVKAVLETYSDKELWSNLAENSLQYSINKFSPEHVKNTLSKIISMCLNS